MDEASGKPGYIASGAAHVVLLAAMLMSFSHNPKFVDVPETVPVDLVTDSAVNQIVKGDKSAKKVQEQPHVDQVAPTPDLKPKPPIADAKRDVPVPPPPLKRIADPGQDDKVEPPKPPAAAPPPPAPKPIPVPPIQDKPPPETAADEPLPPPRPKPPPPKPHPKSATAKAEQFKPDQIAKLLDEAPKPEKMHEHHTSKPKSGDDTQDPPRHFDADDISRLLSHEAPSRRASSGARLQQLASLGSPTASAARMSPSLQAAMDGWFQDKFQGCWNQPITLPEGPKYVPQVRVQLNLDGSLSADPILMNPPDDPTWQPLADSAMRAVRKCDPLQVPDRFKAYYDVWRDRVVQFQDQDM
jgi:colicin import membrane protein